MRSTASGAAFHWPSSQAETTFCHACSALRALFMDALQFHLIPVVQQQPAETPSARKDYSGVQVLRGLAAMLVVLFHAGLLADERFGAPGHHLFGPLFRAGAGGVDIFFPISGFVMVVSTVGLLAQPGASRIFLTRRIIRIVPLYWIATTAKLVIVLAVPALA